jgi:hypothetical protein
VTAAMPPEAKRDGARRGLTRTGRAWRITRGAIGGDPNRHRHTIRPCLTGFFDSGGPWRLILIFLILCTKKGIADSGHASCIDWNDRRGRRR